MAGLVLLVAWTLLRVSGRVASLLGRTGVNVITRILGVILAALAVQLVANGLQVLWP